MTDEDRAWLDQMQSAVHDALLATEARPGSVVALSDGEHRKEILALMRIAGWTDGEDGLTVRGASKAYALQLRKWGKV